MILNMFSEKELLARSEIMIWFKLVWFMKLDSLTKATTCDSCSEATEGSKIQGRGQDCPSLFLSFFIFRQNWTLCVEIGFYVNISQGSSCNSVTKFIFIKFQHSFNVLSDPKSICFTQTIPSMCEPQKEAKFEAFFTNFWQFQLFLGIHFTWGR